MLRIAGPSGPPTPPQSPQAPEEVTEPVDNPAEDTAEPQTPQASDSSSQINPEVARYFGPDMRCEQCIHYMTGNAGAGSCEIVSGPIDPQGVCMLFTLD